jgi:hypothetical protein
MKGSKCFGLVVAVALALVAGVAKAEVDAGITGLIGDVQSTITAIVAAVLVAGAAVLLSMLGLKALPFAYRKISAFFGK